ncbi:MAG: hypothetical protein J7M29_12215 [Verrucomicrobia bacterium]|nr:hypothetical protein [Verrucomicrobiota bacterium]
MAQKNSAGTIPSETGSGEALEAKLKRHKIGLLRSKDEPVNLPAEKRRSSKQAPPPAKQSKRVPPPPESSMCHLIQFRLFE